MNEQSINQFWFLTCVENPAMRGRKICRLLRKHRLNFLGFRSWWILYIHMQMHKVQMGCYSNCTNSCYWRGHVLVPKNHHKEVAWHDSTLQLWHAVAWPPHLRESKNFLIVYNTSCWRLFHCVRLPSKQTFQPPNWMLTLNISRASVIYCYDRTLFCPWMHVIFEICCSLPWWVICKLISPCLSMFHCQRHCPGLPCGGVDISSPSPPMKTHTSTHTAR